MPLLATTTELRKHVTVATSFHIESLTPYVSKANRKYVQPFCGDLAEELKDAATGTNADVKNKARAILEECLANFALHRYLAVGALNIDGSGVKVSDGTDYKAASNFQINDLHRTLLRDGHEALDELLTYLEANKTAFTSYTDEYQDKQKELLVQNVATFEQHFYLHGSRQTYLALVPAMRTVEDKYIYSFLCEDFITSIKALDSDTQPLQAARKLLQKAVVAFTVAKAVYEGQFVLDANGIHLRFDRLPHESIVTNVNLKINDFLKHTKEAKENEGLEYLKRLEKLIIDNPESFTACNGEILLHKKENAVKSTHIVSNPKILGL